MVVVANRTAAAVPWTRVVCSLCSDVRTHFYTMVVLSTAHQGLRGRFLRPVNMSFCPSTNT